MTIVIDVVFVIFLALVAVLSYRSGFFQRGWWLLDIAITILLGMRLIPIINDIFTDAGLLEALQGALDSVVGEGKLIKMEAAEVATIVQTVLAWICLGIIVIILMAILKAILKNLRKFQWFRIVDGILGCVYSLVVTVAILLIVGAIAGMFTEVEVIGKAYDVCKQTSLFKYIFGENPLQEVVVAYWPIKS